MACWSHDDPMACWAHDDPMACWSHDATFLSECLERARRVDLVTIDVFDTALTRLFDSPADLFAAVERTLAARIGGDATGFALAREDAERAARIAARDLRDADEITYQAILDRLPAHLPRLAAHRELVREVEFAAEAATLRAVPDLRELTRRLADAGIAYAFVSDMYLPAGFLAERLSACGFSGWTALHVSSETGATKATGRQWAVVRAHHPGAAILNVGDDQHADIDLPRRHGIETMLYARARSARRFGLPFTPAVLPFSIARRDQVLRARADPAAIEDEPAFWTGLGRTLGGIVLAGFVRWLETQVARHRVSALYFSARDGWLTRQAWQASGAPARTGIADHYLHVARRPLNLARGYLTGGPDRLDQALLGFLAGSDGGVTVRAALQRAGLVGLPALEADLVAGFGSLDTRLVWPDGTGRFEHMLQAHAASVHGALAHEHAALIGYLRQEGLLTGAGTLGLVDLGWHASMQRSLRTLIDAERPAGDPVALHGFYYGLWPPAMGNRYAAGPADAAFASDFRAAESQSAVHDAVEILEELHTAPHGTVLSYREEGGRWSPILADSPPELAQHARATRHFQAGAIETLTELFATGRCGTLRLDDITPEVVRATLGAISLSPQQDELSHLGGLGHCGTFDHTRFETLVPDGLPDDAESRTLALMRAGWRSGTVLRWVERASPEQSAPLRAWIRHMMPHYGERVMRRFG